MIVFRRTTWIDCSSADLTLANFFVVSFSSFIVLGPETHQTGRGHERFAQLLEQVDGEEAEADDALGEGERLQNGPVARFVQRVERFAYLSHSFGFGLWLVFCFFCVLLNRPLGNSATGVVDEPVVSEIEIEKIRRTFAVDSGYLLFCF